MKNLLIYILIVLPIFAFAQGTISFKLTPQATFSTASNEDFIIVPFENKSAHEIYQTLASNIGSLYNNPSKVMNGVEDTSIKIRSIIPISQKTTKVIMLGEVLIEINGFIQYDIKIKHGRAKVSAPFIENYIWIDGGASSNFPNLVSQWFKHEKKEKKRMENMQNIIELENRVNTIINSILGLNKPSEEDNW